MAREYALEFDQITKLFGDFKALDKVSLHVLEGSIHAILGENGAGKTTLMNVLFGLYQPDGGRIRINGIETVVRSPRQAMDLGMGMIHQHFMLVETLSVIENIVLGLPGQGIRLSLKEHIDRLSVLSDAFGFEIDPYTEIWKLPIGMRQRVEILKVLYRDADIVILDEPTSVLAPNEIANFLDGLKRLRDNGKTVIFITHKLEEVTAVADRITIMQHGTVTAEKAVSETNTKEMARLMIGRDMVFEDLEKPKMEPGPVAVSVRDLRAQDDRDIEALKGVSFDLQSGEILGVAGVDGNGQRELAEVLTGLRRPSSGNVSVFGQDVSTLSVYDRRHKTHMSFVPEDRQQTGLVLDLPVVKNAMLRDFRIWPFSKHGILHMQNARDMATAWVKRYDIRLRSVDQHARFLSGGNQQKLIFAREIECAPRILVVMQPCKGLDVGAIDAVQRTVLHERARGTAVLYISTELEHILSVCDRIAVMCAGEITGVISPAEATSERVGALMGGISDADAA